MSYTNAFNRWFNADALSEFTVVDRILVWISLYLALALSTLALVESGTLPADGATYLMQLYGYLMVGMVFVYPLARAVMASEGAVSVARRLATKLGVSG